MKNSHKKKTFLIGLTFLLGFFILIACSAEKNQSLQGNLVKLQGKWQSDEDASAMIEINGDMFISYYDNERVNTETIEFINDEEAREIDPHGDYFIVKGQFDAMIYYLVNVSESKLEYTYTGRGNTLKYTKVQ